MSRFDSTRAADELDAALRAVAVPYRAAHEKAYLKSDLVHYGASVPAIRKATTAFLADHQDLDHDAIMALAEELWGRGVHELRAAAVELLTRREALLGPNDLPTLERFLREARTWALVDGIAPSVVGPLMLRNAEVERTLVRWAVDDDFWLRRAALLAYLLPMRQGEPVFARFARLADPMLEEREFFIRKAIGWVLRERGKRAPDEVFTWLEPRKERASGLTLREASRYLTEDQRAALLSGRRTAARR
ncbi:MAG: DNA alkylation repair protein [Trueperaceae bacterium]